MNIKLEVIRINEDVIATSGNEFCSDHHMHFYMAGTINDMASAYSPSDKRNSYYYQYKDGKWVTGELYSVYDGYFSSKPVSNTYYVLNESEKAEICTKNHYPETIE